MKFTVIVEIEVERVEGKFASREEIEDSLRTTIEGANEGQVDGVGADGSTVYDITSWEVS